MNDFDHFFLIIFIVIIAWVLSVISLVYFSTNGMNNALDNFCSPNVRVSDDIFSCNGKLFSCDYGWFFYENTKCQYISVPINIVSGSND